MNIRRKKEDTKLLECNINNTDTGWRVMPEDEKIKLAQESEVIGQVLGRIRSM